MPKGTPKPATEIENALAPAFERQKQMLGAARKIARAVADLPPADARQALQLVLDAQTAATASVSEATETTRSA